MDLVSIIIPFYNARRTLRRAVESALAQTHSAVEVIICDDGSTDLGIDTLNGLSDPRLRYLRNSENIGAGYSRDRAISVAKGDWIAVLDADDAYKPDRIQAMLEATKGDKDVIIFDDIEECRESPSGNLVPLGCMRGSRAFGASGDIVDVSLVSWLLEKRLLIKPLIPRRLICTQGISHTSKPFAEDTEYFLNLVAHEGRLRYLPRAYYQYLKSSDSASSIASRHRLMCDVLSEAVTKYEFSDIEKNVLVDRCTYEEFLDGYFNFVRLLKSSNYLSAAKVLLKKPKYLAELLSRVLTRMREEILSRVRGGS